MADIQRLVLDHEGVYYHASENAALPANLVNPDWGAANWVELPNVTEDGVELVFEYELLRVRTSGGRKAPTHIVPATARLQFVRFALYESHIDTFKLSIPDAKESTNQLESGGSVVYRSLAVMDSDKIWIARRVAATGSISKTFNRQDFVKPPFEFEALERPVATPGESNWYFKERV